MDVYVWDMLNDTIDISYFNYLVVIKESVTIIGCQYIVSNLTIAFQYKFHSCCDYFIIYFKDRVNSKTTYTKQAFNIILGFIEVLIPNFFDGFLISVYRHEYYSLMNSHIVFLYPLYTHWNQKKVRGYFTLKNPPKVCDLLLFQI